MLSPELAKRPILHHDAPDERMGAIEHERTTPVALPEAEGHRPPDASLFPRVVVFLLPKVVHLLPKFIVFLLFFLPRLFSRADIFPGARRRRQFNLGGRDLRVMSAASSGHLGVEGVGSPAHRPALSFVHAPHSSAIDCPCLRRRYCTVLPSLQLNCGSISPLLSSWHICVPSPSLHGVHHPLATTQVPAHGQTRFPMGGWMVRVWRFWKLSRSLEHTYRVVACAVAHSVAHIVVL